MTELNSAIVILKAIDKKIEVFLINKEWHKMKDLNIMLLNEIKRGISDSLKHLDTTLNTVKSEPTPAPNKPKNKDKLDIRLNNIELGINHLTQLMHTLRDEGYRK